MATTPTPTPTGPDYTVKQTQLLSTSVTNINMLVTCITKLVHCQGLLAQSGGNFVGTVFAPEKGVSPYAYLEPYDANLLLQQAVPALSAFLDTKINNDDALPTYLELFHKCSTGLIQ